MPPLDRHFHAEPMTGPECGPASTSPAQNKSLGIDRDNCRCHGLMQPLRLGQIIDVAYAYTLQNM